MPRIVIIAATSCLLATGIVRAQSAPPSNQPAPMMSEAVFKNIQVLKGIPVDEFMDTMGMFSASLGYDCVSYLDGGGRTISFPIKRYDERELLNSDLPQDNARQAFGRGLAILGEGLIAGGSSPATVSVYDLDTSEVVRTINLTMDVRNTIHGLEVWPF